MYVFVYFSDELKKQVHQQDKKLKRKLKRISSRLRSHDDDNGYNTEQ